MADQSNTDQAIRNHGLRRTIPRSIVARVLQDNPGHHSVGDIQRLIDESYVEATAMARSSIYRALEALEGAGLAQSVRTSQEETQFEWVREPHHHLICTHCGQMAEVRLQSTQAVERETVRQHGFSAAVRHLAIRGTCRGCSKPERAARSNGTTRTREKQP
ncbi:MAG: transcriptional repressor [Chloroflexi bacterium]|nr:transcriptional repressor [Chloroflexota bacterium]